MTAKSESRHTDFIFIGIVGRPHGLHGAFFVSSRTDPVPKAYKKVYIGKDEATAREAAVTVARMQSDRPVIQCSLAASREEAAALTGANIYVSKTVAHSVHQNEALWSDITGCDVVTAAGKRVGRVSGLYDNGATGVVRITGDDGDTAEIPLVPALFDLDDVGRLRSERMLTCLLPDDAVAAFWSRELAKQDEE